MHIDIAERLKPFSHEPGTYFVLPGSCCRVQIFPACIYIDDLSGTMPKRTLTLNLNLQGPVKDFTIQQDLERCRLNVWGKSKQGYFRYYISPTESGHGVVLSAEKAYSEGLVVQDSQQWVLKSGETHIFGTGDKTATCPIDLERLSLGNNKGQDWTLIRRRENFAEIFPLWYRLGQLVPASNETKRDISNVAPENLLSYFYDLFLTGFDFALSPRIEDTDFQGIFADGKAVVDGSPLKLLSEGFSLIRSLFIRATHHSIDLLPSLPPEFHCGRILNAKAEGLGRVDLEWTKKEIRRVIFTAEKDTEIVFNFCRDKRQCRVRTSNKDRGQSYIGGTKLSVVVGMTYWLDRFH